MSDEFASPQPLPCKDQYETAAFTQEHSLGDVVEPRSSLGPRFHLDRLVEFDATAPPRLAHSDLAPYSTAREHLVATNDDGSRDHDDEPDPEETGDNPPRRAHDVSDVRIDPDRPDDDRRARQEL